MSKDELNILHVILVQTGVISLAELYHPVLGLFHHRCVENKPLEPG